MILIVLRQHWIGYQIVTLLLLPLIVVFVYEIEDSSRLFLQYQLSLCYLVHVIHKYFLGIEYYIISFSYQYKQAIPLHYIQTANAFVQGQPSMDVCYVKLVRSSNHQVQYEPNQDAKTIR